MDESSPLRHFGFLFSGSDQYINYFIHAAEWIFLHKDFSCDFFIFL